MAASLINLSLYLTVSLGGYPPFHEGFGNLSITEQIIRGEFTMVPSKWKHISDQGSPGEAVLQWCSDVVLTVFFVEAKDVVRKLLVVDPSKRMSINEALQHPWLQVVNPRTTSLILIHLPALP